MSYKPTKSGAWTSCEATGTERLDAERPDPVELEAAGELPHSFFMIRTDLMLAISEGLGD